MPDSIALVYRSGEILLVGHRPANFYILSIKNNKILHHANLSFPASREITASAVPYSTYAERVDDVGLPEF